VCWQAAHLQCYDPNASVKIKDRWGQWKSAINGLSYIKVCPGGYSACRGIFNWSNKESHDPRDHIVAVLWPICQNGGGKAALAAYERAHSAVLTAYNATHQRTYRKHRIVHQRRCSSCTIIDKGSGTISVNGCKEPHSWQAGYQIINNRGFPYAMSKFTGDPNNCQLSLQTRVRGGAGCPELAKSGIVVRVGLWAKARSAVGGAQFNFCSGWTRYRCAGCSNWGNWIRMTRTSATAARRPASTVADPRTAPSRTHLDLAV
jgi:hypothetical protein